MLWMLLQPARPPPPSLPLLSNALESSAALSFASQWSSCFNLDADQVQRQRNAPQLNLAEL